SSARRHRHARRLITKTRELCNGADTTPDDDIHDRLNRTVLELATSLARQDEARLDVISVWDVPEEQALRNGRIHLPEGEILSILARERDRSASRLDELLKAFPSDAPRTRGLHVRGRPAQALVTHARAERIDTIVMGTVARTGLPGFLMGNTAETVLARVACSVLAVKPEGFVSPVEPGDP
ncbi:universal stress protein, partial [Rubellimicrobium roseum]